ncbi:CLL_collapsed_G0032240.mRNA.1.CDS.1 [Saccharomyces cerevisiae]|uniref:K7_Sdh3p n=1 Tax=Saccharomyces cerevisiae (strain Kyokai no. 7 / NBRC 101557) TaxID=721032 RepID=G2WHP7_YEASK|nr:Sdh3p [Saccharomyces cerevisiae YJM456]AJS45636.1 Sdh3p [Saccharomyces cerevisiae YJM1338]AJS49776.1 Sdh3p [Saccharomyces cerevisiae YJM1401]AJS52487.1 Sdh3p [Saccharomyces cerevisiae YJM1443]AJS53080.1 Sdh3p [Saccharomyces cerevisiae YJM1447]AJS55464.1 Sdh3p [Saccharomyces cerevisiae YJM1527]CAD6634264.1 BJ4_G0006120.mRNA.1.CDS.1 [Saccharomyces cerevisiae]GAA24590.1 K7_Sdh3p [Saccharomyces cerevisiae Kyokai no. 7]
MSAMMVKLGLNKSALLLKPSAFSRAATLSSSRRLLFNTARTNFLSTSPLKNVASEMNTKAAIAEEQILNKQRAKRPISPHLTIYQPQLTWYLSSFHRISLVLMGLGFYLFTILFGVSGLLGLGLTTEKVSNWYHQKFSKITEWSIKGSFAYLFAIHYGGAIRHLIWDTAKELTLKGVYRTGYALIGFTAVLGTYLLTL